MQKRHFVAHTPPPAKKIAADAQTKIHYQLKVHHLAKCGKITKKSPVDGSRKHLVEKSSNSRPDWTDNIILGVPGLRCLVDEERRVSRRTRLPHRPVVPHR